MRFHLCQELSNQSRVLAPVALDAARGIQPPWPGQTKRLSDVGRAQASRQERPAGVRAYAGPVVGLAGAAVATRAVAVEQDPLRVPGSRIGRADRDAPCVDADHL